MILTHWMINKKAVKRVREVYLYEKYKDVKVSDEGTRVLVYNYNAFEVFDKELNQKGAAKELKMRYPNTDYDTTSFYDMKIMSGVDFVINHDNGSSNIAMWDYSGNVAGSFVDPDGRGLYSVTPCKGTTVMFYKTTPDWT